MARAVVKGYEYGSDNTSLRCYVRLHGTDLQVNPTDPDLLTVTGIDFAADNANTIGNKICAAVRTLSASIRNSGGTLGVTIAANDVLFIPFGKG